ncbi:MAG TPA: type II secretion system F family protein [Blastocatellia bacterium]|nr:type II secretion system F family protein [Blastocatellia bacterium]
MAEFVCRLGTPGGEVVTRTLEATAERELRARLEREGFRVFAVSAPSAGSGLFASRSSKRIKLGDFLTYNQQLAALLRAGIPILQAIQILGKRQKNEQLRVILQDVEERIKTGEALSDAFAAQGEAFPRMYVASVLAGERSGSLDEVLARYVSYTKGMSEISRKLRKSMTYPIILICASMILIAVLTTFVVPQFATLYGQARKLPAITMVVVGISNVISNNLLIIIPVIAGLVTFVYFWRKSPSGRLTIDRVMIRIPVVGDLVKSMTVARLARSLSTLLAGGLTVPDAVEIASDAITNRYLARRSGNVIRRIREGKTLTDALDESTWIPELALDMIGVGESSGALQPMFDEVANFYDAEIDVRLNTLTTLIEPLILVFMGGLVLTILLAIYLPILTVIGTIGQGRG